MMARETGVAASSILARIDVPASAFAERPSFIHTVREGIAGKVVRQAVDVFGQRDLFVRLVGVSPGNLHRVYRRKTLSSAQSEALLDTLRLFSKASEALGGLEMAREWLNTPLPALHGERPFALCDTFDGRRLVADVIAKIEYGEFP